MILSRIQRAACFAGAAAFLLCAPAVSRAETENTGAAENLTSLCAVEAPSGRAARRLTDGSVETYSEIKTGASFRAAWGEDAAVAGVYLEFYALPAAITIAELDASGAAISETRVDEPLLNDFYPLGADARGVEVRSDEGMMIAEAAFYGAGELPMGAFDWSPPAQKADLLVISAHCDDELLYFGGTIPTYAGERGLAVQVAYMANEERLRLDEAMNGLRVCGDYNAPVLVGFKDAYTETLAAAEKRWGHDATVEAIVALIRRFRPEVVVTHDLDGEYGHGAHRATALCTLEAVSAAADGTLYPASAELYGAWQVKKLYLHLYDVGAVTMDWRAPLAAFGGKTALDVANEAYAMHVSQQEYHQNVYDSGEFSSAEFGLAHTTVGQDTLGGDFFENIPPDALTNYVPPTPSPTPEPTPTPSPAPTAAPTATPTSAPQDRAPNKTMLLVLGVLGALALACAVMLIALSAAQKRCRKRRKHAVNRK